MVHDWRIVGAISAVLVSALVAVVIWLDRASILETAEEATSARARLIAAHGDAALGEANQVALALLPEVEAWDFIDAIAGAELHRRLQRLVVSSPRLASAWIVDASGMSRLDTWSFPSEPIDAAHRDYFRRHVDGESDPVIAGSEIGSVTGTPRFTYSVSVREPQGDLKAVIVVAVHTGGFSTLYDELTRDPGTIAGFYKVRGDILAESASAAEAGLRDLVVALPAVRSLGSAQRVQVTTEDRQVVAVRSSSEFPGVLSVSATDVNAALSAWKTRAALLAVAGAGVVALVTMLSRSASRVRAEQEARRRLEFASHEVQHRMKNALQLIGSFIRLRARGAAHPETRQELSLISNQLNALSKIQALLDVNEEPGAVDVIALVEHLCSRIESAHGVTLARDLKGRRMMDSGTAGRVAIILNELVTNAMKHGDGRIRIEVGDDRDAFEMTVANGGRPLTPDFSISGQAGFGLSAMKSVAESMGAELVAREKGPLGGAEFRLRFPAGDAPVASAAV
jgi:two-component sensor histidine kinase